MRHGDYTLKHALWIFLKGTKASSPAPVRLGRANGKVFTNERAILASPCCKQRENWKHSVESFLSVNETSNNCILICDIFAIIICSYSSMPLA